MTHTDEYLRRNLLVAKAIGARSVIPGAAQRLMRMKRPPKWLLEAFAQIDVRLEPLPAALSEYRDLAKP